MIFKHPENKNGGAFWLKSEPFLTKIRTAKFECSAPPPLASLAVPQKSFLFLLEEKIGRAQIKKCRENFSVLVPPKRSGGGRKRTSLFWILFKESSNIVQKTPPFLFSGCLKIIVMISNHGIILP